ncbi:MAG: hypothetical protein KGD58_07005 [Candidatus Lokiarchaeota archaeon]|nr:hypothetical protein [Candidatus Lokiarchaeota archaeon]
MTFGLNLNFDNLVNHSTLLYGETNTYKTYQTSEFVKFLLESKHIRSKEISILDFAPSLMEIKNLKIGGQIQDFYKQSSTCNNIIFKGDIIPPRLKSSNKTELYQYARENLKKTSEILNIFNGNPTPVLIINDISIYLHIGSIKLLLNAINKSNTFFGNTYFGSSIKRGYATLFSLRERRKVKSLINKVEQSYHTG